MTTQSKYNDQIPKDARSPAIVLIDPVSSGKHLKSYIHPMGYRLIAIFTLTQEQLKASGKDLPLEEKYRHCDDVLESNDIARIENWLKSLQFSIHAIVAASEPAVELADCLAQRFGLVGNNPNTSGLRRNKYEARTAVRKAGLSGPDFMNCTSTHDIVEFSKKHSFPLVIKTPEGAGAHHVFICHDLSQALSAHKTIMSEPNLFGKDANYTLIEEFIQGPQFVVELFAVNGNFYLTSLWEFEFGDPKNGKIEFERARLVVDQKKLETYTHLVSYAISVANALDLKWGPCLVELRDDPRRGAQLIEMGARLSGIELPVIVREVSSFDPFLETLKVFLGKVSEVYSQNIYRKCAALIFVRAQKEGIVKSISGLSKIKNLSSYFMSLLTIESGSRIYPSKDLASIPLYAYLVNEVKERLDQDEKEVRSLFQVEVEPYSYQSSHKTAESAEISPLTD